MARIASRDHLLIGFLTELARLLIRAGIGANELEKVIQASFVRAASKDARLQNARINQSAIAAMTGLTRPQVRMLIREDLKKDTRKVGFLENLISGWTSDPEFCVAQGRPRPLTLRGDGSSFLQLARRYGGDITPRALLAELVRRGLAKVTNGKVRLARNHAAPGDLERQLERLFGVLAIAVRSPKNGTEPSQISAVSREFQFPAVDAVSRVLLERRMGQSIDAFSHDLEAAISALSSKGRGKRRNDRMSKMSVIVIAQD